MVTFLGLNLLFGAKANVWMDCGLLFIFYGLYYGVLGRDISEICADKMAAHIGVRNNLVTKKFVFIQNIFSIMHHKVLVLEV